MTSSTTSTHPILCMANGFASDARTMWLPAFILSILCVAQDYVITNVLGIPRTFARFAVWNALYTFGWVWIAKKRSKSILEASYVFGGNCAMFAVSRVLMSLLAHVTRTWLFVPIACGFMIAIEYGHFCAFNDPATSTQTYTIRKGKPSDSLFSLVIASFFAAGSYFLDCSSAPAEQIWKYFLIVVPATVVSDTLFGIPHNLSHRIPWLWKKHKIHHEYRGNELNTFANFYSELFDGFLMSYPIVFIMLMDYVCGIGIWHGLDSTIFVLFSHHKYANQYIASFCIYEFDILLDVLLDRKLTVYHNQHHVDMSKRFSISGYVTDGTLSAIGDMIYGKRRSAEVDADHKN